MTRLFQSLVVFFALCAFAFGQVPNTSPSDPVGSCNVGIWVNQSTGKYWYCNNGTWAAFQVAGGKTFTASNSITLAGTDATTMTFPSTSATIARTDAANTFSGVQTFSAAPVLSTNTLTSGAGTITFPTVSITVPGTIVTNCGTTSTCAATVISSTSKVVSGQAPLVSGTPSTVTITGFSPAFASATSYACSATDMTTATNNLLKVVNTSASSITITGPNTLTDVVAYVCVGN